MSDEVLQKLQDRASMLTAERKKRGKTIPEGLASAEDIAAYKQLASHTVSFYCSDRDVDNVTEPVLFQAG